MQVWFGLFGCHWFIFLGVSACTGAPAEESSDIVQDIWYCRLLPKGVCQAAVGMGDKILRPFIAFPFEGYERHSAPDYDFFGGGGP